MFLISALFCIGTRFLLIFPKLIFDFSSCSSDDPAELKYDWFEIGVLDYDSQTKEFFVQKVNTSGRVVDGEGNPVVNGGFTSDGKTLNYSIFKRFAKSFYILQTEKDFKILYLRGMTNYCHKNIPHIGILHRITIHQH